MAEKQRGAKEIEQYSHIPKDLANIAFLITNETLSPFHYRDMYNKITNSPIKNRFNGTNFMENFRNRLQYNDYRFEHIGNGKGIFTLSEWLNPNQLQIISYEHEGIEYHENILAHTYREVGLRTPYMLNKYNDKPKERFEKVLKGLTAQNHVKKRFKEEYQDCFIEPNNRYNEYGEWDFAIKIPSLERKIRFDVKSVGFCDGQNAIWIEKNRIKNNWCDFFIGTTQNGKITLMGYVGKDEINKAIQKGDYFVFPRDTWHNCRFMFVYLNHLLYDFNFPQILQSGYIWRDSLS